MALLLDARAMAERRPPLLLISIDGLKPDLVLKAERFGLRLRELRRLVAEGAHALSVEPVLPAVTYPNHVTMVTGAAPARHGIHNNRPLDPLGRNQQGWQWYTEDIKVPTLWDVAEAAGMKTASVAWPVTVGARISYNIPQYWRAGTQDDQKLLRALATPGLLAEAEAVLGPFPSGRDYTVAADVRRAAFAIHIMGRKRPQLMLVHLGSLDRASHDRGPQSKEALLALEDLDRQVGLLRQAAERSGGGSAFVAVVSDHGFLPTSRAFHLNVALAQAGLLQLDRLGKISSWRAYAWPSCGSAAVVLSDPEDTQGRERARMVLDQLLGDAAGGVLRILDGKEAARLGAYPQAAFVVILRDGYEAGFRASGPLIAPSSGGTHGYAPDHPDMAASFFLAGPGIPAGMELGRIHMRDIGPTLAGLLGVQLPAAEGPGLLLSAN